MNRKSVVLGIFDDRIDVLSMSGEIVVASRRVPIELGSETQTWQSDLARAAEPLGEAVTQMQLQGASTIVLYRSPSACSDSVSVSLRSMAEARQAAILGLAESLTCGLEDACTSATVVGRDAAGNQPQTHVVSAGDHEQTVSAIVALVESAGLTFEYAIPLDAMTMLRQASEGLSKNNPNRACLFVGEHRSFLIISSDRSLVFARSIGLGVNTLVMSLTRAIRQSPTAAPIELSIERARELLHQFGFPQREQVLDETLNLTGANIIPLLQPVLQRFIVELRQSLRFGVQEEKRQGIDLTVTGPGCTINNFSSLIANELRLAATTDHRYAKYNWADPASPHSELVEALADRKALARLGLRPFAVARTRQIKSLQRWLWAGAAAALGLVAMDAAQYHSKVAELQERLNAAKSQASDVLAMQSTGERMLAVIAAMSDLENSIAADVAAGINVRACMQEISRCVPDAVRLSNIYFVQDKGTTVGRLTGFAFDSERALGRVHLEPLVEKLKQSPLFQQVALATVQAASRGEQTGQQFEITVVAVAAPRNEIMPVLAAGSGAITP